MTIADIKKLIANDESRVLELKKSTGELVKGMQTLCACKAAGVPEPSYGTDGLFVWITFKRPGLDTNLDTNSDTNPDTNPDSNSDSSSDSNLLLSDRQKEVLLYCIFPRTSREILEHINVTYQKWNIDKFINTLIDAGLLERTIPNTPNSPNQKYVIKRK